MKLQALFPKQTQTLKCALTARLENKCIIKKSADNLNYAFIAQHFVPVEYLSTGIAEGRKVTNIFCFATGKNRPNKKTRTRPFTEWKAAC